MQKTYKLNHKNVDVLDDVCDADYASILDKYGLIDVVIGGPPCQGFSNANRQKHHAINQNNMLVKQYIRAVLELQPKAFVLENVAMLRSDAHRFFLDKSDEEIVQKYKIVTKDICIPLLDKEYEFSDALNIIKSKDQITELLWPDDHFDQMNLIFKSSKNANKLKEILIKRKSKIINCANQYILLENKNQISVENKKAFEAINEYFSGLLSLEELILRVKPAIMIQRMLRKSKEIFDNNIIVERYSLENGISVVVRSYTVLDYLLGILGSAQNGYAICSDVLSAANFGVPQKRKRFVVIGVKRTISETVAMPDSMCGTNEFSTVRDAIFDLEEIEPFVDIKDDNGIQLTIKSHKEPISKLRDSNVLLNHIVTKTTATAMARFRVLEPGQNFHALEDALKTNTYTDASRTQNTIYLRLDYDEPSVTVTNVRKSMWIHPSLNRSISVREAARLQSFPDSFVFCGSKDKQYQQVGNAVPPLLANAIALKLAEILDKSSATDNY